MSGYKFIYHLSCRQMDGCLGWMWGVVLRRYLLDGMVGGRGPATMSACNLDTHKPKSNVVRHSGNPVELFCSPAADRQMARLWGAGQEARGKVDSSSSPA